MTDQDRDHGSWQELAVAHALDALEPAEDQQFRAHLAGCRRCQAAVAEAEATMADLAYVTPPAAPPPALRQRLLDAAGETALPPFEGEAPLDRPAPRPRVPRQARWWSAHTAMRLAVAATVVLLAVIAAGVWTLVIRNGPTTPDVAARCAAVDCPTVPLRSGAATVADVMVLDHTVYVRPTGLAANQPTRDEYVLWRLAGKGAPTAVGGFDVTDGGGDVLRVGPLTAPLADVTAFAVTKEPGRTPPAAPSGQPVAVGQPS